MLDRWLASVLLVLVSACGATPAALEPNLGKDGPLGDDGQWERIYTEEFDGRALDTSQWTTCYWWDNNGCTNLGNNELQWYTPANAKVAGGNLRLTARAEEVTGFGGRTFGYTSGMVTTGRYYEESSPARFAVRYGYFEIRAKIPAGRGLWPALWLLPTDHESKPEIDIMEVLGHAPDVLEMHFHYADAAGGVHSVGHEVETPDLSQDWHVYGLEWRQDALVWYLDGIEQWRYADRASIPDENMYLLVNLAVGGDWPGDPDADTEFPAHFLIDYVRVWRRAAP